MMGGGEHWDFLVVVKAVKRVGKTFFGQIILYVVGMC